MPEVRISVVMIVKDEVDRLGRGLESFASLGDLLHEVCIYDTGSTDGTIELARRHGATVREGYWDDDFARARNEAAAMATGDWLFVVDADESIRCDPFLLSPLLSGTDAEVDGLQVAAVIDGDEARDQNSWVSVRLYRNDRVRYTRPVHTSLERFDGNALVLGTVPDDALLLVNGGFDAPRIKRSLELKDRLTTTLLDSLAPGEHDRFALTDRGRARLGQGRYDEALDDLLAADALGAGTHTTYTAWAKELAIETLLGLGRGAEARPILDSLEALGPGRAYTRWLRGRVLLALRKPSEALHEFAGITLAVDGGFSPLNSTALYREALQAALEADSPTHTLACLVALTGATETFADYAPMLARLWRALPASPLRHMLALSADRSLDELTAALIRLDGDAAELGHRLGNAHTVAA